MKYRCKTCGTEGEGDSLPACCAACGSDELEANPFDARCAKCGQGYFESDKPTFCPACGNRLSGPVPSPKVRRARQPKPPSARTSTPPPVGASTSATGSSGVRRRARRRTASPVASSTLSTSSDSDYSWLKTLAWILGIGLVLAIVGWLAVFIIQHWVITLIVVVLAIVGVFKK